MMVSLWTDVTSLNNILSANFELTSTTLNAIKQYPNPASNIIYISFKIHELSVVSLELYDQHGRKIYTIIDNKKMEYGKYVIPINIDEIRLQNGIYYPKISINDTSKTLKIMIIK